MEFTAATAVTVIPHYLFDRIELLSTEGNVITNIYGDNIYLVKLHKTLEQHNRERQSENLGTTYDGVAIAANTLKRVLVHIPCFIDGTQLKLSAVRDRMIMRVYFSPNGVTAGVATDINVSLCDVIQKTQQLSGALESMEQKRNANSKRYFRFLNNGRIATETRSLVASSQYDVRLTSANGMYAYLYFIIRTNPLSGANINNFVAIDSFELYDRDGTIVGIKMTNEHHKLDSLQFDGDILNYKNVYTIAFALSISAAHNGNQTGFYKFSGDEYLRLYTPAGLANDSYRIDVFGFEYNTLKMEHGRLDVCK